MCLEIVSTVCAKVPWSPCVGTLHTKEWNRTSRDTGFTLQSDFLVCGFTHLLFITEMASAFNPRECKLSKQEGQNYGFFLRIEKDTDGHLVRVIEKGSPAEKAGLLDGDRVLRINSVFVDKEEHAQVNGYLGFGHLFGSTSLCTLSLGISGAWFSSGCPWFMAGSLIAYEELRPVESIMWPA